jgi:8-oxo-dGTP diphosphatase
VVADKPKLYNIRVYAVIVNDQHQILLSEETRNGFPMTKLPGGGHEFGEGLKETLQRELKEELGVQADIGELFYVNDFSQISVFNQNHQLISFYFRVDSACFESLELSKFPLSPNENVRPVWAAIKDIDIEEITFPIDKKVISLLKKSLI